MLEGLSYLALSARIGRNLWARMRISYEQMGPIKKSSISRRCSGRKRRRKIELTTDAEDEGESAAQKLASRVVGAILDADKNET